MKNDFAKYLSDFLLHYLPSERNASQNTIRTYRDTFRIFLKYCETVKGLKVDKIRVSDMKRILILDFLDWLETSQNNSVNSRNNRLAALHSFFRYIQGQTPDYIFEISQILAIRNKKAPKKEVDYLTADELKVVFSSIPITTARGRRDLLILLLLYDTAARVQELVDICFTDVHFGDNTIITLHGKGSKVRSVPIPTKTAKHLEKYMKESKRNAGISTSIQPLFINSKGEKLSRWGITYILKKYIDMAKKSEQVKIDFPVTPHIFRHTKAMHLLQANINLIYIRDFLGHSDIQSTEIYARADNRMKIAAIKGAYIELSPEELPDWNENKGLMEWLEEVGK